MVGYAVGIENLGFENHVIADIIGVGAAVEVGVNGIVPYGVNDIGVECSDSVGGEAFVVGVNPGPINATEYHPEAFGGERKLDKKNGVVWQ